MGKKYVLLALVVFFVVFNVVVAVLMFTPGIKLLAKRNTGYNPSILLQQVQTVSELTTVKYVIEKVVILEDVKWLPGWGESRVLLLAHGVVKGGVDLSKLLPGDITISGKTVTIALPAPKVIEAYLDERQTRVIERTTGLLRTFDKDLEQNARIQAITDIRTAALQGGILKDADSRARAQISAMFRQLGYENVEFKRK